MTDPCNKTTQRRIQRERAATIHRHVEATLGRDVICDQCGATLDTFAEVCTADLDDACPGFRLIEATRQAAARRLMEQHS